MHTRSDFFVASNSAAANVVIYNKAFDLILTIILLSSGILHVLGDYRVGIQQDQGVNKLKKPNQANLNFWSLVAVYDKSVLTTDFTSEELYALAQLAHQEMKTIFETEGIGNKRQPATMAAMAIGNLVYFSSSIRSKTNLIMEIKKNDIIDQKLNQYMTTLQAKRKLQDGQLKKHINNVQRGEVTCLELQRLDQAPDKPVWDSTP